MTIHNTPMTPAQMRAEIARCEFCEEKPCRDACPVDCSPADFIMAVRLQQPEDIQRSAALIMTRNPLGGVCGGVCPDTHCQAACVHAGFDRPVEIPSVQSAIVQQAKELGRMPALESVPATGQKIAIVGAGPAGIGAAVTLAQHGLAVTLFERESKAGGACALVPAHRLPPDVLASDLDWALDNPLITLYTNQEITNPEGLLADGFDSVLVCEGLHSPIRLSIPGEETGICGNVYLKAPEQFPGAAVAVIGGGAIGCDCATVAKLNGADLVEMFALENLAELPLTAHERQLLLDYNIDLSCRTAVTEIGSKAGKAAGIKTQKVILPVGESFHPTTVKPVDGSSAWRREFDRVIVAIGNRPGFRKFEHDHVFFAGDGATGPSTVVEAVAAGKNSALQIIAQLGKKEVPEYPKMTKSHVVIPGYAEVPIDLETTFFGRKIPSPLILSAAPPTDGYDQMKLAYEAGWSGGIMKTAFDNVSIHIPADYMHVFDGRTYGNCDNVSGHSLSRVCREIEKLAKEYPDRLTAGSTGGPVSGNDEEDARAWVQNMKMLEDAGAQAVEFSLSCPQGGDGTEGDIVSQSSALTAKIVDWIMSASNPDIPKLFKLTGAVTSIAVIVKAIKEVLDRYPDKKGGVTLANTFPTLAFRPRLNGSGVWDEGVLVGMSGEGVAPISNLSLATVAHLGVEVSGNGGPMDYRSAAHFLALGVTTVQFCTVAMKYGVGIINELHSGIAHMMQERGMKSMDELIGSAIPNPITDFMELTPVKRISSVDEELCMHCGNCTRCSYNAITLDENHIPVIDASLCIGCSLCTQKCFAGALTMRVRTPHELDVLIED